MYTGKLRTWTAKCRSRKPTAPFGLKMALVAVLLALLSSSVSAAVDNQISKDEQKDGWIQLFDGKTLNRWMTSDWQLSRGPVENGSINPHNAGAYMMVYEEPWENFILVLDFKISPHCNSGILLRTSPLRAYPGWDVGYNAIEVQILDSKAAGYYDTGAIYDLSKPRKQAMKPAGEWNHIEIKCDKNLIDVALNGEHVNHIDLDLFTQPYLRPDGTKHKFGFAYKYHPRCGYIGLQDHGANCWFKNIKLKPL
jgi:opacity protein-like surface antigen